MASNYTAFRVFVLSSIALLSAPPFIVGQWFPELVPPSGALESEAVRIFAFLFVAVNAMFLSYRSLSRSGPLIIVLAGFTIAATIDMGLLLAGRWQHVLGFVVWVTFLILSLKADRRRLESSTTMSAA
jgi:hypothetical protein